MTNRKALSFILITSLFSGCLFAQNTFNDGYKKASSGDYASAVTIWQPLAEKGGALAQSNLGILYENGWGVTQSPEMAVYWYKKAAEQGQADAQHNLGTMYQQGVGIEKDLNSAGFWFEKAANKGHGESQIILGVMYQEIEDFQNAVYWYDKAVKQNVEGAQKNIDYLCQIKLAKIKSYCSNTKD
tara:strand:+ start:2925 stop:3479 length:555 start_codon:yes stop_codon:yes gene_type:complete